MLPGFGFVLGRSLWGEPDAVPAEHSIRRSSRFQGVLVNNVMFTKRLVVLLMAGLPRASMDRSLPSRRQLLITTNTFSVPAPTFFLETQRTQVQREEVRSTV